MKQRDSNTQTTCRLTKVQNDLQETLVGDDDQLRHQRWRRHVLIVQFLQRRLDLQTETDDQTIRRIWSVTDVTFVSSFPSSVC